MSRRTTKPAVPSNIQALINQNNQHAYAVEQAKMDLAKANETRFREEHHSIIRNAEVRRNMRRSQEEARLARLDLIVDRRAQLAELFAREQEQYEAELQAAGLTLYREDM